MQEDEPLLTIEDLAKRYRVTVGAVYVWNSKKTGPRYLRAGRRVHYRLSDVLTWETQRLTSGGKS